MAKWGEGDARWKVEDRPDGANVNQWHWTERNVRPYCEKRLRELLASGLNMPTGEDCLFDPQAFKIDDFKGDATIGNRKGKRLVLFDLSFVIKFEGWVGDATVSGKFKVSDFDQDEKEDCTIDVSMSGSGTSVNRFRSFARAGPVKALRAQLFKPLCDELFTDESLAAQVNAPVLVKDVKPAMSAAPDAGSGGSSLANGSGSKTASGSTSTTQSASVKDTRDFTTWVRFGAPPTLIYECLFDPGRLRAFTQADASVTHEAGSSFSMFNGNVTGVQKTLDKPRQIVQSWRFKDWPEDHFSTVTLTFEDEGSATKIVLKQTGIPSSDVERTRVGWDRFYWHPIKACFGFQILAHA